MSFWANWATNNGPISNSTILWFFSILTEASKHYNPIFEKFYHPKKLLFSNSNHYSTLCLQILLFLDISVICGYQSFCVSSFLFERVLSCYVVQADLKLFFIASKIYLHLSTYYCFILFMAELNFIVLTYHIYTLFISESYLNYFSFSVRNNASSDNSISLFLEFPRSGILGFNGNSN